MAIDLDHEYNTRAWAPDFATTIARHGERGARVRARSDATLDLRWGAGPRQTLDFFPAGCAEGPLVVAIHGGYWQYKTSTKASMSFLAPPFLERGIAFCAIGYELCPDVTMDAMVAQLTDALRWIRTEGHLPSFTPRRIVAIGHSAGGHLAAMLALSGETARGISAPLVDAACGVSGLYDLDPIAKTYLNEAVGMSADEARRNSPVHRVGVAGATRPIVVAVGAKESGEFKRQANVFAGLCAVPVFELEGRDHYDATEALCEAGPFQSAVMAIAQ